MLDLLPSERIMKQNKTKQKIEDLDFIFSFIVHSRFFTPKKDESENYAKSTFVPEAIREFYLNVKKKVPT